jgi:hypothetical protein
VKRVRKLRNVQWHRRARLGGDHSSTLDGAAAVEQLEIVLAERVSPAKFVWLHAQNEGITNCM